jgi:transcriptional regulator with XRE-family HTH domain
MKNRIQKFLEVEQISASKFADEIGVQRSSISHILSGRNNPSLEVIQKILTNFDYINAEWLITGKGEMFKPTRQPTLFDNINTKKENEEQKSENIEVKNEPLKIPDGENKTDNRQNLYHKDLAAADRIVKVILLYNNGKAEVFEP